MSDTGWIVGCLGIVVVDHLLFAARRGGKRIKAIARHKLGNKFSTEECLSGSHQQCHKHCGECGNPCECACHWKLRAERG